MTPADWKRWYAAERAATDLDRLVDEAPSVPFPRSGALVFPHAKLAACGRQVAAVARAVVASGADEVIALGVLHGGGSAGPGAVAAAKAGDPGALKRLRRVHGPGTAGDEGFWRDEFSLDNFRELLEVAAKRAGRKMPRLVERFPFLAGATPGDLPGVEELRKRTGVLVATTDPAHHGHGYGTPAAEVLDAAAPSTAARVRSELQLTFGHLARRHYAAFLTGCDDARSDFRDTGPAMRELLPGEVKASLLDLEMVDYSDVLAAPSPTWVAAALAVFA